MNLAPLLCLNMPLNWIQTLLRRTHTLAVLTNNLGQMALYERYLKQAFDLKDRAASASGYTSPDITTTRSVISNRACKPGSCIIRHIPTMRHRPRI